MSTCVDVVGRDITESLMITLVVIVFDESSDCLLQLTRHIVGNKLNPSLDGAMVSLNLAVRLRMIRGGYNVSDTYQSQVIVKLPGQVTRAIVG